MGSEVYANGREISCKAAAGKTICAFPDVCFTPPQTPATPPGVPIPYPNTGMASDTTSGSKNVKIGKKEVGLKNKSYFKTSTGDEAGSAPKKGVITSKTKGKVYFKAWSMDVKVEGKNVPRHLDITTNNHASETGDTPTWPYVDRLALAQGGNCENDIQKVKDNCENDEKGKVKCPSNDALTEAKKLPKGDVKNAAVKKAHEDYARETKEKHKCETAAKCLLSPYSPSRCCKPQTPHHLVPKSAFFTTPFKDTRVVRFKRSLFKETKVQEKFGVLNKQPGASSYDYEKAPCVCCTGGAQSGTHGLFHDAQARHVQEHLKNNPGKPWTLDDAINSAVKAMQEVYPHAGCDPQCIEAQLKRGGHEGADGGTSLKTDGYFDAKPKDVSQFKDAYEKTEAASLASSGGAHL